MIVSRNLLGILNNSCSRRNKPDSDRKKAVSHQPVNVAIEASGRAFQLYHKGVFSGECSTSVDHGIVSVGYGTENGMDYWLVRNYWGTNWGEDGYIKLQCNVLETYTGKCGITMEASYPVKTNQNPAKINQEEEKIMISSA
ncbi:hypothetical protein LWI29_015549 [Acer saccharum]|uniref:Peptidase C1A papain C-terminal domain-containing protein n=1 Tax=Acer saccharum TaxID=4024 RepID=A0AA39ST43_ACESA|nr:hypothetical protein LWI29_015549 [Acer saccharum]